MPILVIKNKSHRGAVKNTSSVPRPREDGRRSCAPAGIYRRQSLSERRFIKAGQPFDSVNSLIYSTAGYQRLLPAVIDGIPRFEPSPTGPGFEVGSENLMERRELERCVFARMLRRHNELNE